MNSFPRPHQCSQCSGRARYTCPKCSVRTCSLSCVQAHKDLTGCDGIRVKTSYVGIKDFTNIHLLSDYRLLEEINRVTDNAFRNKMVKCYNKMGNKRVPLPHWLHRLQMEARVRGTTLKIMPHMFTRRKENSSCFVRRLGKILWQVEWQFPQARISCRDKRVDEDSTLESLLSKYFDASNQQYSTLQTAYSKLGLEDVNVLLGETDGLACHNRYYRIELNCSLKDALRRKTIIEYPTFLVILKDAVDSYEIIPEAEDLSSTPVVSQEPATVHESAAMQVTAVEKPGPIQEPQEEKEMETTELEESTFEHLWKEHEIPLSDSETPVVSQRSVTVPASTTLQVATAEKPRLCEDPQEEEEMENTEPEAEAPEATQPVSPTAVGDTLQATAIEQLQKEQDSQEGKETEEVTLSSSRTDSSCVENGLPVHNADLTLGTYGSTQS